MKGLELGMTPSLKYNKVDITSGFTLLGSSFILKTTSSSPTSAKSSPEDIQSILTDLRNAAGASFPNCCTALLMWSSINAPADRLLHFTNRSDKPFANQVHTLNKKEGLCSAKTDGPSCL